MTGWLRLRDAPVGADGGAAQEEGEDDDEDEPEVRQEEPDEWDDIIANLSDDEEECRMPDEELPPDEWDDIIASLSDDEGECRMPDEELPPPRDEAAGEAPQAGEGVPPPPPVDSRFERVRRLRAPDAEAVARHNVCHWPYQSWCPICVRARGREDQHRVEQKKLEEVERNPVIWFDYNPSDPEP